MSDKTTAETTVESNSNNGGKTESYNMMHDKTSAVAREELKVNLDIGGALARALVRNTYSSVARVAEAGVDELTDVYGVGEKTAKQLTGKAQGRIGSESWEPVRIGIPDDATVGRMANQSKKSTDGNVAVVWGDGQLPGDERQARVDLDCALADAHLEPDAIGRMDGADEDYIIRSYVKFQCQLNGKDISQRAFAPDWSEYGEDEYAQMFEKRDKEMCAWADHLVIVASGPFSKALVSRNLELSDPADVHVYIANEFEWEDEEEEDESTIDEDDQVANGSLSEARKMQEANREAFEDMVEAMEDNDEFTDGHGGEAQPDEAWSQFR